MAFVHGKNTAISIRDSANTWRDMSVFLQEVSAPFKIDTPETTHFALGAKTYIAGLRDGSVSVKGMYDSTATTGPDVLFSGLLGTVPTTGIAGTTTVSVNGMIQFAPSTAASPFVRYCFDAVLSDYSISAPVANVVSFTANFQISGAVTRDATAFVTGTT